MLYWVAGVLNPTKKEKEDEGKSEKIVLQPKIVVAKDEQSAAIKVILGSDELKGLDKDKLQIMVSSF